MAIARKRATTGVALPGSLPQGVGVRKLLSSAAGKLGRAAFGPGPGRGIRGYGTPEGFPEHEWQQMLAGRHDRVHR